MPFQKGQSGNPDGRKKGKSKKLIVAEKLQEIALNEQIKATVEPRIVAVFQQVVEQALDGCTKSQKLIWESYQPRVKAIPANNTNPKPIININVGQAIPTPIEIEQSREIDDEG